jgi:hypothetical protein
MDLWYCWGASGLPELAGCTTIICNPAFEQKKKVQRSRYRARFGAPADLNDGMPNPCTPRADNARTQSSFQSRYSPKARTSPSDRWQSPRDPCLGRRRFVRCFTGNIRSCSVDRLAKCSWVCSWDDNDARAHVLGETLSELRILNRRRLQHRKVMCQIH